MCWIIYGAPELPTYFVGVEHNYIAYVWVALAQYSFFLASTVEPGRITKRNVKFFSHQPYDGLMFVDGLYCKTCELPKVLNF